MERRLKGAMLLAAVVCAGGCAVGCDGPRTPSAEGAAPDAAPGPTEPAVELPDAGGLEVVASAAGVAPIGGGTLAVTPDGRFAIVADPDRGAVWRVRLADASGPAEAVRLGLPPDAEPGRVALSPDARIAYVALRGAASLLALDVETGAERFRVATCAEPRGLTVVPAATAVAGPGLWVACTDGRVAVHDFETGAARPGIDAEPDLRDAVVDTHGEVVLTTFRHFHRNGRPPADVPGGGGTLFRPAVAWRTLALPQGGTVTLHQLQRVDTLPTGAPYYGSGGCGGGVVLSAIGVDGGPPMGLNDAPLPVDLAVEPAGRLLAYVAAGVGPFRSPGVGAGQVGLVRLPLVQADPSLDACLAVESWQPGGAFEPVAVAIADGAIFVHSRQPLAVLRLALAPPADAPAPLFAEQAPVVSTIEAPSVADTGHDLFHRAPIAGSVACASCHPEGEDDGHVWDFQEFGLRRTPSITGGLLDTAPFHWSGELADFGALADEVMTGRMRGPALNGEAKAALGAFIDGLRPRRLSADLDAAEVERGRALFFDAAVGCAECHVDGTGSDNLNHNVGTGEPLQTPTLRNLRVRSPYMHDGCAAALEDRFEACGGDERHGHIGQLGVEERLALVAYLKSL